MTSCDLALPTLNQGANLKQFVESGSVNVPLNTLLGHIQPLGQGGLGRLILDGLRRTFWTPMTIGASLSIILALVLDGLIYFLGRMATPWSRHVSTD